MSIWSSVPQDSLPAGALNLPTYPPDALSCVLGHRFSSEEDCVLPEGYDHFLCRRCVDALKPTPPTLPPHLRGDGPCAVCGTVDNIVWFTDNVVWNTVVREPDPDAMDTILCISCFVVAVERRGISPTGWRLTPEFPVRYVVSSCDRCGWIGYGDCPRGPGDHS